MSAPIPRVGVPRVDLILCLPGRSSTRLREIYAFSSPTSISKQQKTPQSFCPLRGFRILRYCARFYISLKPTPPAPFGSQEPMAGIFACTLYRPKCKWLSGSRMARHGIDCVPKDDQSRRMPPPTDFSIGGDCLVGMMRNCVIVLLIYTAVSWPSSDFFKFFLADSI